MYDEIFSSKFLNISLDIAVDNAVKLDTGTNPEYLIFNSQVK